MSNTAMAAQPHQTNQITSSSDQIRDAASALPSGATTPKPNKSPDILRKLRRLVAVAP
jgi:hypothetical protein